MAELAAQGNLHEVDYAEADQTYEDIKHMIPHNVMIGNLLRNIYPRLQVLEKENKSLKKEVGSVEGQRREGYLGFASMIFYSHLDRLQRTNLVVVKGKIFGDRF